MSFHTANPEIAPPAAATEPGSTGRVLTRLDDQFYEELSRINNELANLQRELARTNAESVAGQKKLAISEQRYRNLSACLPIGIFELDASGRCVYTNSHWQAISGLTAEESLGDGWQRALDPRDAPAFLAARNLARQGWEEFAREVRFVNVRGDQRWAQVRSQVIPGEGGEAAARVSTVEDITERKYAEKVLEERFALRERLAKLAVNVPGILYSFRLRPNGATSLPYASPTIEEFFGLRADDLAADASPLLNQIHPEDRSAMDQSQAESAHTLLPWRAEFRVRHPKKSMFWVEAQSTPEREADGSILWHGFVGDITERKRAEDERERLEQTMTEYKVNEECARRALEHERELSRVKSRFVSMVSHEFRTPLSVINMGAELLNGYFDQMTPAERSEQLQEIQSSVGRMTQMMTDFLVYGNCTSGNLLCKPVHVAVEALCRQFIAEVPAQPGLSRPIECTVDADVGEALLDEKILRHILGNLLSNAVKYSFDGQQVQLEVKRVSRSPRPNGDSEPLPEAHLQFKVSDSGIGIPAADMARLYQTFHRASNVSNRPGTGMGLAIVKQFVDLLRGNIRIESTEGKGTVVWVELPITAPAAPAGS